MIPASYQGNPAVASKMSSVIKMIEDRFVRGRTATPLRQPGANGERLIISDVGEPVRFHSDLVRRLNVASVRSLNGKPPVILRGGLPTLECSIYIDDEALQQALEGIPEFELSPIQSAGLAVMPSPFGPGLGIEVVDAFYVQSMEVASELPEDEVQQSAERFEGLGADTLFLSPAMLWDSLVCRGWDRLGPVT